MARPNTSTPRATSTCRRTPGRPSIPRARMCCSIKPASRRVPTWAAASSSSLRMRCTTCAAMQSKPRCSSARDPLCITRNCEMQSALSTSSRVYPEILAPLPPARSAPPPSISISPPARIRNPFGVLAQKLLATGGATVVLHSFSTTGPQQNTTIAADRLLATLANGNSITALDGSGHTSLSTVSPNGATQTGTGDSLQSSLCTREPRLRGACDPQASPQSATLTRCSGIPNLSPAIRSAGGECNPGADSARWRPALLLDRFRDARHRTAGGVPRHRSARASARASTTE